MKAEWFLLKMSMNNDDRLTIKINNTSTVDIVKFSGRWYIDTRDIARFCHSSKKRLKNVLSLAGFAVHDIGGSKDMVAVWDEPTRWPNATMGLSNSEVLFATNALRFLRAIQRTGIPRDDHVVTVHLNTHHVEL